MEVGGTDKQYIEQVLLLDYMTPVFTILHDTCSDDNVTVLLATLTDLEPGGLVEVGKADKIYSVQVLLLDCMNLYSLYCMTPVFTIT